MKMTIAALAAAASVSASAALLREASFNIAPDARPVPGETLELPAFDGKTAVLEVVARQIHGAGAVTYSAKTAGSWWNNATFVLADGGFSATVSDNLTGNVLDYVCAGGKCTLRESSQAAGCRCGTCAKAAAGKAARRLGEVRGVRADNIHTADWQPKENIEWHRSQEKKS